MSIQQEKVVNQTDITPRIDREPLKQPVPANNGRIDLFKRVDFTDDQVGFHGGSSRRTGIKLAMWTWLSASVDTLIMIALSCVFVISFSMLMKSSAPEVLRFIMKDLGLAKLFFGAFLFSFWMYMIFLRGFNGATIGEWTCSLRLGQPWQRMQPGYILKVLFRTTLIMATGIITIPIISLILNRDLAGDISGVKIYSLE